MHSAKEKISNMASAAKAHVDISKAKVDEKVEKATARSKEGKHVAEEQRKAKEAEAKMRLHEEKAEHAAEKFQGKHSHLLHGHHQPVVGTHDHHQPVAGTAAPGTTVPTNPLGGHTTGHHHNKYV
ncbi:late embryogenesis abundant protein 18 [Rhododendron vialii]|uniref:late embryogenesis abundant protein 18 n=1 Tax=Rhododendron vialii TaxID=182163 RepID=UPI0026602AEB|nr:late embryogenesis abundant protein 18 [Rhododendron vialii]